MAREKKKKMNHASWGKKKKFCQSKWREEGMEETTNFGEAGIPGGGGEEKESNPPPLRKIRWNEKEGVDDQLSNQLPKERQRFMPTCWR